MVSSLEAWVRGPVYGPLSGSTQVVAAAFPAYLRMA
jgi:hypothetical protein